MRLFIAILFSPQTVSKLQVLQDELRSQSSRGRFSPRQNLHMTLAFLGDVDDASHTKAAMDSVNWQPFDLEVNHVAHGRRHQRNLWLARVVPNPSLINLQRSLGDELKGHGVDFDERGFLPHITLARDVETNIEPWSTPPFGGTVTHIHLMRSDQVSGGTAYTSIHTCAARN